MNRIAATLAFVLFAAPAAAQLKPGESAPHPSERWFSLAKTSTGFVAGGNLAGTLWAFHVRGENAKPLGEGSPPMFSIDGVILQVKAVSRAVLKGGGPDLAAAHKQYEQDFQRRNSKGVVFTNHDMCRNAKVPHQQWVASVPGGISQAFVTFEVGDYVLMVVAPYEDERRRQAVVRVIDDVCTSFLREKAA